MFVFLAVISEKFRERVKEMLCLGGETLCKESWSLGEIVHYSCAWDLPRE